MRVRMCRLKVITQIQVIVPAILLSVVIPKSVKKMVYFFCTHICILLHQRDVEEVYTRYLVQAPDTLDHSGENEINYMT